MTREKPITWNDIAQMLACSDQSATLNEANAAIAAALPGYSWRITVDPDDPLAREKMGLVARHGTTGDGDLCPEQVRDAVWDHNPDAPDPVTPFAKAIRAWRKQLLAAAAADSPTEDKGEVSDGYHTFNELYEHRHALFLALAAAMPGSAWASRLHADGTKIEGWFIAGITLRSPIWADEGDSDRMPSEFRQISYHLPDRLWPMVEILGIVTENPPAFDGHTSDDVVARLMSWAKFSHPDQHPISSAELIARTDTPEIRGAVSERGSGRHT